MMRTRGKKSFSCAILCTPSFFIDSLLLSDLPTPSFVVDVQALQRVALPEPTPTDGPTSLVPSMRLPSNGKLFKPHPIRRQEVWPGVKDDGTPVIVDVTFRHEDGQPSIAFFFFFFTRAREDVMPIIDDPTDTFLAEIDLFPELCGVDRDENGAVANLVLGLNNHHVGSYYWARSAGSGSSMEAPGVLFGSSRKSYSDSIQCETRGILRWIDAGGPICCNSNDGKRSEWVNFLRKGDTVQLVPLNVEETLIRMNERFCRNNETRLYGISSQGRPMGSEPEVVCEWREII